jgi:hypothetical protein
MSVEVKVVYNTAIQLIKVNVEMASIKLYDCNFLSTLRFLYDINIASLHAAGD